MYVYVYTHVCILFPKKEGVRKKSEEPRATPFAFSVKQQPFPVSLSVRRLRPLRVHCRCNKRRRNHCLFFLFSGCQLLFFLRRQKKNTLAHTVQYMYICTYYIHSARRTPNGTSPARTWSGRTYLGDGTSTNFLYKTRVPDHCAIDDNVPNTYTAVTNRLGFSPVFRCRFRRRPSETMCVSCAHTQHPRTAVRSIVFVVVYEVYVSCNTRVVVVYTRRSYGVFRGVVAD